LAKRSRKRGRRGPPGAEARGAGSAAAHHPALPTQTGSEAAPSRSEQRNAAVRARLEPLGPGERPWALKIAALIALLIGAGDLVVVIVDGSFRVGGAHTAPGGVIMFSVLMLVCAVGMWQLRYWAVLGFQAILVFVILIFSLLLLRAANLLGVLAGLVVVGGGGYLFFKLVRVLSRLQMPKPPAHS